MDAPTVDPKYPPSNAAFKLTSGGTRINATLFLAAGAGPHATVVLLHGRPGVERNFDLAQALRRAGYHVLTFNYRGSWGSGGLYSLANTVEDTCNALVYLRTAEAREKYGVDPARLVLFGHSAGGYAALQAAARDPAVRAVAALAPMNETAVTEFLQAPDWKKRILAGARAALDAESGPLRAESAEATFAQAPGYNFLGELSGLRGRPVLLIAGTRDTVLPITYHHEPILKALRDAGNKGVETVILDDDHAFAAHRVAVMRAVVGWMRKTVAP
ncbi:MAG: alpha/beta fold hydrolase [Opitutus sp.]|nr:alpha/beta fold hydrolase [Opitutus sp.]